MPQTAELSAGGGIDEEEERSLKALDPEITAHRANPIGTTGQERLLPDGHYDIRQNRVAGEMGRKRRNDLVKLPKVRLSL